MTITAEPEAPYHSPRGLFDFQAEGVAQAYYTPDALAVWDTGLGKTHLAMALAAFLFADDEIDLCLVVAETNKVGDWVNDFARFTNLEVKRYRGTPTRRAKIRESPSQVLVGTFETVRNDAAKPNKELKNPNMGNWLPGPLIEDFGGKRMLIVWDEIGKLRNRSSDNYKAHETLIRHARETAGVRVLGLTATSIDTTPENVFNIGRLIVPGRMGTLADFERDHCVTKNWDGKWISFKNIGVNDKIREPGVRTLREKFGPTLLVKSKFDDDVKDQFPKQVEEFEVVQLGSRHRSFYDAVRRAFYESNPSKMEEKMLFGVLRQIAGHPMALTRSKGALARAIVDQVGEEGLRALGSAKEDYLLSRLHRIVRIQHAKAIVFTFYGQTILPVLHESLTNAGFNVVINHGQMSQSQREASIEALRYGAAEVFLSSDAGSRGLNLPEAHYVENYECPLTYANYRQRNDRVHRIDSLAEIVFTETLMAEDTVEEPISDMVIKRNRWHDTFMEDDDEYGEHLSAEDRRALIKFAKERTKAA